MLAIAGEHRDACAIAYRPERINAPHATHCVRARARDFLRRRFHVSFREHSAVPALARPSDIFIAAAGYAGSTHPSVRHRSPLINPFNANGIARRRLAAIYAHTFQSAPDFAVFFVIPYPPRAPATDETVTGCA